MKLNYKKEYKKRVEENVNNILEELGTPEMELKIQNWADKFGLSFQQVKNKIKRDKVFRCVFAKDPAKQNIYQTLAAKRINSLRDVKKFSVLPSLGKNALYLIKGKIFNGEQLRKQAKDIKSLDFSWQTGKYLFYASHKYTEASGGAQDNQYNDIQDFLDHSRDFNNKNTIFLAICDGNYYLRPDSKTGDATKIERLRRLTDARTSFVLTIEELPGFLKKYL